MPVNSGIVMKPQVDYCRVYGTIYIEKNRELADYTIFVSEIEAFADLIVYKQDNQMMADDSGLWFITKEKGFADHIIFLEDEPGLADFTIFYTDTEAFATCN